MSLSKNEIDSEDEEPESNDEGYKSLKEIKKEYICIQTNPKSNDDGLGKSPTESKKEFIYIRTNPEWETKGYCKYGYTKDLVSRNSSGHSEHIYKTQYLKIFEINRKGFYSINIKEYDDIFTKIIKKNIINYLIEFLKFPKTRCEFIHMKQFYKGNYFIKDNDGGTEFIKNSSECIELFSTVMNKIEFIV